MLIRKLSVFLFCIVIVLAIGGNASGADVKAEESKTVIEYRGTNLELTFEQPPGLSGGVMPPVRGVPG